MFDSSFGSSHICVQFLPNKVHLHLFVKMADCLLLQHHTAYVNARAEHHNLRIACKALCPVLNGVLQFLHESTMDAWSFFKNTTCRCTECSSTVAGPGTYRLGASWASAVPGDIANLNDLADIEDI